MKKLFLCMIMCLYALIGHAQGTYHDYCMSFGPYSIEFEVSNTQHTSGHTDKYQGSSGPDIIYRLIISVPMEVAISSRCSAAYSYSGLYLLDSGGRMLDHNDDDYDNLGYYIHRTLPAGTYYVVSDYSAGTGDYITTSIRGSVSGGSGTSQATAINAGIKASDFTYSDTKNLSNYTDVISYISGKDIFYKFTLAVPMDISISNCGSAVPDTYIGLFVSGTNNQIYCINTNDDSSDTGSCPGTKHAYMKVYSLQPGTYCVISAGKSSMAGQVATQIRGVVSTVEKKGCTMSNPVDIGVRSSAFVFSETLNVDGYPDEFEYACEPDGDMRAGNGVFYKFTLSGSMDISISHAGSAVSGTYIHLLNSSGTCIKHDNSGAYNNVYSSLKAGSLPPGVYYIYSEACNYSGGNITLTVKGEPYGPGLSSDQNYILTITPTVALKRVSGATANDALMSAQYFDGLGRPAQTVQIGVTPGGHDLVTRQEYDACGRKASSWLPVVAAGNNGAFVPAADFAGKAAESYTGETRPYAMPVYENSPLNRILEQYGPGQDWHNNGKKVSMAYLTNIAGDAKLNCKLYLVGGTSQNPTLSQTTNYTTGRLYVTGVKDEDGNTSYEFKDKLGRVVLTRQMDGTTPLDTYYVYDDFGNKCFVLPPRIQNEGIAKNKLNLLAYQYKYDHHNRCIAKKIPGCEWIYYVYDQADRLIFTQDGEQRTKGEWTFTIPDAFGRIVLTGICIGVDDNPAMANGRFDSYLIQADYATGGDLYNYNLTLNGNQQFFLDDLQIYSVNYYDHYDFRGQGDIPAGNTQYTADPEYGAWYGGDYSAANRYKNKGLLTGTLTADLDSSDGYPSGRYFYCVTYYDDRKRPVQVLSDNHLTGGLEKEYIAYNFTGQPVRRKHIHSTTGKSTRTEVYAYTYDHAGRLLKTTHQLTDGTTVKPQVTLAENTYDDLGRLKTNKKGGQANLNTTYAYNVRSWTSSITNAHFNEVLTYSYNGNISSMQWRQAGKTRKYNFTYDNLSRLKTAAYTGDGNFNTAYSYDKHGNIKTLQRYGLTAASTYGIIDNLTAEHTGNQLKYITDAGPDVTLNASMDFKDYTKGTGIEYTYNANGAMVKDMNKGISAIAYNSLNLPRMVDIKSKTAEGRNEYTYSASGQKLKAGQRWNPNYNSAPVIGSDINVSSLTMSSTTDYVGNVIYENNALKRILVDGGYYEGGNYYFYINDHLGNNRIVANAAASVVQSTQYYPFGMPFADATGQNVQPYKYNNKELDGRNGLNWYDYSARYLALDFPVMPMVDPMAEKFYSISPYVYCANNPLKYIDPTGMWIVVSDGTNSYRYDNGQLYREQMNFQTRSMEYVAYTPDVGSFAEGILNGLNDLVANSTGVGQSLVDYFSNDQNNIGISTNALAEEKGNHIALGEQGYSTIYMKSDLSGSNIPTQSGMQQSPFWLDLGHEIAHGHDRSVRGDAATATRDGLVTSSGEILQKTEVYATFRENQMRGEAGLPLRTHYYSNKAETRGVGPSLINSSG